MPLCLSKVEQIATEDLVELSEIEKHNLGGVMLMIVNFVESCCIQCLVCEAMAVSICL